MRIVVANGQYKVTCLQVTLRVRVRRRPVIIQHTRFDQFADLQQARKLPLVKEGIGEN
jgi:hypothetical protein